MVSAPTIAIIVVTIKAEKAEDDLAGPRHQREQRTFAAILSAADCRFDDPGYGETTVEMIAADAGVSPGTVYNYFGTKNAILTAVVTRRTEAAIGVASEAIDLNAIDPVDALMPVIEVYVDVTLGLGAEVLKELFIAVLNPVEPRLAEEMWSIDERAIGQIAEALSELQIVGALSEDVNTEDAALVVYSLIATAIIVFMSMPSTTPAEVKATIRRQLSLVFTGFIPR